MLHDAKLLNRQDRVVCYSRYEQRGLPWQDLRFGKNRRPLSMRQTAHDSDGDTNEELSVAVGESQAKFVGIKGKGSSSHRISRLTISTDPSVKHCFAVQNQEEVP